MVKGASPLFWFVIACIYFLPSSSIVFLWFSKAFPKGEYINFACSITFLESKGSVSSSVSYLSILPYNRADVFAAFLVISYCNVSSLHVSSNVMISFYILPKRFFLKREKLSDATVALINKKEKGFAVHFL